MFPLFLSSCQNIGHQQKRGAMLANQIFISLNSSNLSDPFTVVRNLCVNSRIWSDGARLYTPRNNTDLNTIHKEGSARVTTALSTATFWNTTANVRWMNETTVNITAFLIGKYNQVDFLKCSLDNASGLFQSIKTFSLQLMIFWFKIKIKTNPQPSNLDGVSCATSAN